MTTGDLPVPAIRPVLEAETPPAQASVRNALDLLHRGEAALETLAEALAAGLDAGAEGVRVDRPSRLLYATDASIYEMEPLAVVFPRSVQDVQHVMRVAGERGVPVLPRGGGTSLAGQGVNHAIVLDFTPYMREVIEVNVDQRWARVQPGVVLAELNRKLKPHGLHYPIDPSTANQATIGGGIGNNSCGAHSVLYGKTLDQVIELEVVLSDGTRTRFAGVHGAELAAKLEQPDLEGAIYRGLRRLGAEYRDEIAARFPDIPRRVSGYNLDAFTGNSGLMDISRMIVGSEGTLATVTEARVRLQPLPAFTGLAAVHFETLVEAAEATVAALEHDPSAVELVDDTIIERCRESIGYAPLVEFVQGSPGALLLIEFYDDSLDAIEERIEALTSDLAERGLGYAVVRTTDGGEQARMWRMRQAGLGILMSVRGDAKPVALVEDTAVPPERLAEFVARFDATVARHGTTAAYYGHASVGCLHIRPQVNVKDSAGLATMERIAEDIADLVLEFGGSLSGEHGDGILRGVFTERMFGPRITEAFREVKRTFDPHGLLNPGKIIDTPPFRENLRLGPATVNAEVSTYFDFSADGGLALAAEQCNGQGACRKHDGGMCPSYMVTLDEEHSTRGRANLLRQVLNGALPREELTGERLFEALDLCVECKACKSECPSGVDMAKLKYELLAQRYDEHGVPLRARAFAHINLLSRLGSRAAPFANAVAGAWPVRELLHRLGGVHRDRPLPRLAARSFRQWWAAHEPPVEAPRGEIVYFDDTFTDYYHPDTGIAAVRVLEALSYRVTIVTRLGCCGRPAISKGQLGTAREWARRNVIALHPFAARGVPIVGTEPSCLLTLRDEYPELLGGEHARTVASQALLIEELIARLEAEQPGAVSAIFRDDLERSILLHGHCHQKALTGMDATLDALALVPGYRAELIDSGCCGMAGSFGFEAEHYEISRAMGDLRLFPAVAAASEQTVIAITGVSCRQQLDHFTDRHPRHVVELLAEALRE